MDENKKSFIRENVKNKHTRAGKSVKRLLRLAGAGIFLGVIAACTAVLTKPAAQKYLGKPEETPAPSVIIIPRDEISLAPPAQTEKPAGGSGGAAEPVPVETEQVEEIVQNVMEGYEYSLDDLNSLWNNVAEMCREADKGIVVVSNHISRDDWISDNTVEKTDVYSGVVIAHVDDLYMILTMMDGANQKDEITVTTLAGDTVPARFIKSDSMYGLSVISISEKDLTQEAPSVIMMGNSYQLERGDMIIAVGSPMGKPHSTDYSWISYIERNVREPDGFMDMIYTQRDYNGGRGTWILNTSGKLVGWAADKDPAESGKQMDRIMAISKYKSRLERMINKLEYAYMGVYLVEVTQDMKDKGMPAGMYVLNVIPDSPAYGAGMQPGDIICSINDYDTLTSVQFENAMERILANSSCAVMIYREGREDYSKLAFEVEISDTEKR